MELSALCVLVLLPFLGPTGMGLSLCDLRPPLSIAQRHGLGLDLRNQCRMLVLELVSCPPLPREYLAFPGRLTSCGILPWMRLPSRWHTVTCRAGLPRQADPGQRCPAAEQSSPERRSGWLERRQRSAFTNTGLKELTQGVEQVQASFLRVKERYFFLTM